MCKSPRAVGKRPTTRDVLVVNPISKKSATLKTSAAFELHVAWLLGLCGLSTIVLGDYEHLFDPETNIPRGSVDVLAGKGRSDEGLILSAGSVVRSSTTGSFGVCSGILYAADLRFPAGGPLFEKQIKISRTDLYERVWTTPLRTLAKEFELSDVGLAKLCRRHDIPLPGRGYWVRMQFGKNLKSYRIL